MSAERKGWCFATAREPARFGLAVALDSRDIQHAYAREGGTLCGIAEHEVEVYLTLFDPEDASTCLPCQQQAMVAPTQPCGQERLHDRVLAAAAELVRDELLAALRQGADIKLWINAPATAT